MTSSDPWPTEIRLDREKRNLTVAFDTGEAYTLAAELLRVHSPSAEVQGHSPEQRVTVSGKRNITIREVVPVGNYAIQIIFDDEHSTGFYRWSYLADLGRNETRLWQQYEAELAGKGLSRG
ncbi:MAG: DUF971 domain-containing protein [Hyphomicrobiaceae bacterium]